MLLWSRQDFLRSHLHAGHPLLSAHAALLPPGSSGRGGMGLSARFSVCLSHVPQLAFLHDHRVGGKPIFPGAGGWSGKQRGRWVAGLSV